MTRKLYQPRTANVASPSAKVSRSPKDTEIKNHSPKERSPKSTSLRQPELLSSDPPLPAAGLPPSAFVSLPGSESGEFSNFLFVRSEKEGNPAMRAILGSEYEWKRRFVRVINHPPGYERLQLFRTEKRKASACEAPMIREMLLSIPLHELHVVSSQYLPQDVQLQFDNFDPEINRVATEYVYGHIRLVLVFKETAPVRELDICCTSSVERDLWATFFVKFICSNERAELLAYESNPPIRVSIPFEPEEGVQHFVNFFLSGVRPEDEKKSSVEAESSGQQDQLEVVEKHQRTVSPLQWEVLLSTSLFARKPFKVECVRTGVFTLIDVGEFPIDIVYEEPSQPYVFLLRLEDPSVASMLNLFLNEERALEVRCMQEPRKFRQWINSCFGITKNMGFMKSFHGKSLVPSSTRGEGSVGGDGDEHDASPRLVAVSTLTGSTRQLKSRKSFASVNGSLRRKVVQIIDSESFNWKEMGSLAFVEFNIFAQQPEGCGVFAKRIVALDQIKGRLYVLEVPPGSAILLDIDFADITDVTGSSGIFGDAGFTLHLRDVGIEVKVVPLHKDARKMWTITLRNALQKIRPQESREEINNRIRTEHQDPVFEDSLNCHLCGKDAYRTGLCSSGLLHTHYLTFLETSKDRHGSFFELLPPRTVHVSVDSADEIFTTTINAITRADKALRSLGDEEAL